MTCKAAPQYVINTSLYEVIPDRFLSYLFVLILCLHSGGDGGHQQNNAELQGLYPNITVYPRTCAGCNSIDSFMHIIDAARCSVRTLTLYVSNNHIRVTNDAGLDFKLCHHCLFALNGQPDSGSRGPNERMFIGLNRIIKDLSQTGYGVCSATLSWACPWCQG